MAYYDLISENEESTVVAEFEKGFFAAEAPYMSESNLKDQFVAQLGMQAYDFLPVSTEEELIANLRKQLEQLNGVSFNASEWKRFFSTNIAKPNSGIIVHTKCLTQCEYNYYDNKETEVNQNKRRRTKTIIAFENLPNEFNTEDVERAFDTSRDCAYVIIGRFKKDKLIEKVGSDKFKKLSSAL